MKSRIIQALTELSSGENNMSTQLKSDLKVSDEELKKRSNTVLRSILHHYSFFSVTTIDSFFQRVVRSFAKEIGIHSGFKIELDQGKVIKEVIGRMILKISKDQRLLSWLTDFAISEINEGKSWDTIRGITSLSHELFKEKVALNEQKIFPVLNDWAFIEGLVIGIQEKTNAFERTYQKIGNEAVKLIEKHGLNQSSFSYGANGVAGFIYKASDGEIKEPGKRVLDALSKDAWVSKTSKEKEVVHQLAESGLRQLIADLVAFYEENIFEYNSLKQVSKNIFAYGLLTSISREINEYKSDNELMLISDFQLFLNEIIHDSDSPYIYEKMGIRYRHYLIDEFQDTSSIQWSNFKPLIHDTLSNGYFNMVVGDVKQSIYRWRGGDWNILLHDVKQGIAAEVLDELNLSTNRRSKQNIVEFNNSFFDYTSNALEGQLSQEGDARINKAYMDSKQDLFDTSHEGLIQLQFYEKKEDPDYPLEQLVSNIQMLQKANYALSDLAILVRVNREGRDIAKYLLDYQLNHPHDGFRYDVLSSEALFIKNNKAVHLLLQVLSYMTNPSEKLFAKQVSYAWAALFKEKKEAQMIEQLDSEIPQWEFLKFSELVYELVRYFDLMNSEENLPFVMAFMDMMEDFLMYENDTVIDFLEWWEDHQTRSIQVSGEQDAMTIMTIHQSKGLQFKAVLIPYCGWALDHKSGFTSQFLWSDKSMNQPGIGLPLVPIKYSSSLSKTIFKEDYQKEKHDIHLDNLNLLYVALTRSEEVLFLTSPIDRFSKQSLKNCGHLVYDYAISYEKMEENVASFTKGKLPDYSSYQDKRSDCFSIEKRASSESSNRKVALRNRQDMFSEEQIESINYGDIVHWIFSNIQEKKDFTMAIDRAVLKFGLNPKETDGIKSQLRQIWNLPKVSRLFSAEWNVKNESSILLVDGSMKRPDRVIYSGDEAIVIDYKTGFPSKSHVQQVKEYKMLLLEMGYTKVGGFLIYFSDPKMVEV